MIPTDFNVNEFMTHLTPGKVIDLQLGGLSGVRIKPTVIGLDIGRYLLVKFPSKLNTSDYQDVLLQGNGVIVRYIVENGTISPRADSNWSFAPLPGTSVLFDTGPKAKDYVGSVEGMKIAPAGEGPEGFARFKIDL